MRLVAQSQGCSIHGIFQAGLLEWLPIPSPGNLPNPGIEPMPPVLQTDPLPAEPSGKPQVWGIVVS